MGGPIREDAVREDASRGDAVRADAVRADAVNGDDQVNGNGISHDTPEEDGGAPLSLSRKLPVAVIFGTKENPDKQLITAHHLGKLPQETLDKILGSGQSIGGDDVRVHRLGSTGWYNSLVRLQQYLDHGNYYPFNPSAAMHVLDDADKVIKWPGPTVNATSNMVRNADATHNMFLKEVGLYRFAHLFKYPELRGVSASKLRTSYPIFARETLALLEHVYRIALEIEDQTTVDFILECFEKHRDGVVKQPEFLNTLRTSVKRDPLGLVLLEHYITSASLAEADQLLAQIPRVVKQEREPTPVVLKAEEKPGEYLAKVVDAVYNGRLVVAVHDGYGTLLGPGYGYTRNRDFKFVRSELLLIDHSRPASGRHNSIVLNSRGERGDILSTLIKQVPLGLGATAEVNAGISNRSATLDREMRTYPGSARARSRSPTRL